MNRNKKNLVLPKRSLWTTQWSPLEEKHQT